LLLFLGSLEKLEEEVAVDPVNSKASELRARIVELEGENARLEKAARGSAQRLESLIQILGCQFESIDALLERGLDEAILLTASRIGYIYRYDEDKREFELSSWSKDVMSQCSIVEKQTVYQLEKTGIWGDVVRERRVILVNDFAAPHPRKRGYPEGHAVLQRFLSVPVFFEGRIVAVVAVANKDSSYDQADVRQLTLLLDGVWKIVLLKEAEAARRELERRMQQVQRLESLGVLASGMAHDFNNLLGAMVGYTEMVQEKLEKALPASPVQAHLKNVLLAGQRASELVQQLLALGRQGDGSPQACDLGRVTADTLKFSRATLPKHIEICQVLPTGPVEVLLDPALAQQILLNLCSNAAQAMTGAGGTLTVTVTEEAPEGRAHPDGSWGCLVVTDSGCGMSPEIVERIFDPFFSTRPPGQGTGLGLSVVHGLVTSCGGQIQVQSEPGRGSSFRVFLPRRDPNPSIRTQ